MAVRISRLRPSDFFRPSSLGLRIFALVALLGLLRPSAASACAVCYGDPSSPMSAGLTWAIVALGALVVGVLAAVVAFFVQANRKAALLAAQQPAPDPTSLRQTEASPPYQDPILAANES